MSSPYEKDFAVNYAEKKFENHEQVLFPKADSLMRLENIAVLWCPSPMLGLL